MSLPKLTELLANFNVADEDFFLARYIEEDIENKDEVIEWWGGAAPPSIILLGAPGDVDADDLARWLGTRGEVMAEVLGGTRQIRHLEEQDWELSRADVIMVLGRDREVSIEFDAVVLDVVLAEQPDFRRREFQVLESAMVEILPTRGEMRSLAADFGVDVDQIDWDQPINELGRTVLRVAHDGANYKNMVIEIHRRFGR